MDRKEANSAKNQQKAKDYGYRVFVPGRVFKSQPLPEAYSLTLTQEAKKGMIFMLF
jgi:hypothetical protein